MTGQATLIASGIGKKDHPEGILTLDSVANEPAKITDSLFAVKYLTEANQRNLKSYYEITEAIRKNYKLSDTISPGEVNIISERHKDPQTVKVESSRTKYGKPEAELIITEQMQGYNSLLHLLNGKIPGLVVLGDTSIAIRPTGGFDIYMKPLILIDGNQATFGDLFLMPVFLVDRIDVLKSAAATSIFGFQSFGGVINVITKAGGEPGIYYPPDHSAKHRISGYNAPRIFYSPQHLPGSDSDLNPDMRNTLFWNPDLNLDANKKIILNFYNGDNSSTVKITAEGITSNGIPVTGTAEYEVR